MQRRILKSLILFLGDVTVFYAALLIMLTVKYQAADSFLYHAKLHLTPFSIIFCIWLIIFYIAGLYELRTVKNSPSFYDRFYKVFLLNAIVAISVFYLAPHFQITPRMNLFITLIFAFLLLLAWRWTAQNSMAAKGASRMLFFGFSKEALELINFLRQNPQLGYLPTAIMAADDEEIPSDVPLKIFSFKNELPGIMKSEGIEIIIASSDIKKNETLTKMLFQTIPLGIPVIDFLSFYENVTGKIPVSLIGEIWFLENLVGVRKNYYEFFKRVVDIAIAAVVAIPAILLLPLIATAIKLDSPGSVFFRQKRVGRGGKELNLIKYRSMIKDAEKMGWKKGDGADHRHTKVGAFLRQSYLDELPQILNIVKGEMSFVGPRPERPEFVNELKNKIPFYEMRLLVKPGITGWAQVNMENDASVEDAMPKLQYDLAYIKNRSVWLDITIALKTVATMLSRGGR